MVAIKVKTGNAYDIYAVEDGGRCELLDFLAELRASNGKEFLKLIGLFDWTADYGRIKNVCKFKLLQSDIYEFKTYGGIRVLCFFDGWRMVILTNGFKKTKNYNAAIQRAINLKVKYLNEKTDDRMTYRTEEI